MSPLTKTFIYFSFQHIPFVVRYIAVCHPFYYRESTVGHSVRSRVLTYVIPVIIFSSILNIPKFLETEIMIITEVENNQTVSSISYDLTDLRQHPDYIRLEYSYFSHNISLLLQVLPELVSSHLHMHSSIIFPDFFQLQDFLWNKV